VAWVSYNGRIWSPDGKTPLALGKPAEAQQAIASADQDAAKDATTLMSPEAEPTAYAKKAGEVAQSAMQDIPARLFAYAEVAKKAQTDLLDTVVTLTPKAVEEATAQTKAAVKSAAKKVS
jgi:hypothetical protein